MVLIFNEMVDLKKWSNILKIALVNMYIYVSEYVIYMVSYDLCILLYYSMCLLLYLDVCTVSFKYQEKYTKDCDVS